MRVRVCVRRPYPRREGVGVGQRRQKHLNADEEVLAGQQAQDTWRQMQAGCAYHVRGARMPAARHSLHAPTPHSASTQRPHRSHRPHLDARRHVQSVVGGPGLLADYARVHQDCDGDALRGGGVSRWCEQGRRGGRESGPAASLTRPHQVLSRVSWRSPAVAAPRSPPSNPRAHPSAPAPARRRLACQKVTNTTALMQMNLDSGRMGASSVCMAVYSMIRQYSAHSWRGQRGFARGRGDVIPKDG